MRDERHGPGPEQEVRRNAAGRERLMIHRFTAWLIRTLAVAVEAFEFELRAARQRRYEREHPVYRSPRLLTSDSPEMDIVHEYILRDSLRRALHRFSPSEQTPEA